ncbi:signal recognition particle subunit [Diatrype stigma]|uniref:Signal recognition particle subunit n=1 Tax=Diatrype stigma TaxID=117547 RepID=A0AAN9V3Q0_9PEZI
MSHAQIEEVSDSDLSDPSEGDIDDFVESDIMRQVPKAAPTTSSAVAPPPPLVNPAHLPPQLQAPQVQPSDIKDYQCIYPVYFDATRTRGTGRRVSAALAVKNPLAREIATACAQLRLQPVFEAHRTHPADWANPGRVKVPLKKLQQGGAGMGTTVKNKHHLYVLIARHLQQHPTTEDCDALRRVRVPGLGVPADGEPWPRPAVPRGWKMGELLPAYSAAMTGGGVSENAFKDMMKEMGGPPGGGAPGAGAGGMMPPGMGGMGNMAEMMNMFGGMGGGGGAGPSGAAEGGGGRKGKKGKK